MLPATIGWFNLMTFILVVSAEKKNITCRCSTATDT